ncbi:hypothetical protein [Hydrogenophaga sp.]|uniref:hypothetical protein n=1 Tax=Hydrogenophaga sp. TaxID=1904254 RepID=UPI0035B39BB0
MKQTSFIESEPMEVENHSQTGMLRTLCYSLLYILSFHYVYVAYINPTFEYAHYTYLTFSNTALICTYLIALAPILAYKPTSEPAQAIAAMIYALSYVPTQLSLLFTINIDYFELLQVQILLALSMSILFYIARAGVQQRPFFIQFEFMDRLVTFATIISLIALIATNIDHMRIVSFEDVYDLRFEAAAASTSTIVGYMISWLSYCFLPYLYARGIIEKKWTYILIGLLCSILLYMATGSKASILLLPIIIGLSWLWGSGENFLPKLLFTMALTFAALIHLIPDDGLGMWSKSIIFVRVVGSSGWVASKYYEFFNAEGLTYYSHIGIINSLTNSYSYGDLSLGQVIGLEYSGSSEANFNASFWASDGFAALGPLGVLVITPFLAGLLYSINIVMGKFDSKLSTIWLTGFYIALLNVPLSTALFSGGGLLILLQALTIAQECEVDTRKP